MRPMQMMLAGVFSLVVIAAVNAQLPKPDPAPDHLLTVAERSEYLATSRHAEVVALLDAIAAESARVRRVEIGQTVEGRSIPAVVIADPPVETPGEARRGERLVVLLFGNIHAGEVDGKEALLVLARELALREEEPLLKDLIVIIAPIYNADGNERMAVTNRPGQAGPAQGMGIRENAQGLDLNRDFIKMKAPETRALVRFINEWDPAVILDAHTTNGSWHRHLITYAGPKVPAGDAAIIEYFNETMMPAITRDMSERAGMTLFPYGNFADDRTRWTTFPAHGRYSTSYFGLRGRLGVLSESYSYAPYEDRVLGTLAFCRGVLRFAADRRAEIRGLVRAADTRAESRRGEIAIRSEAAPAQGQFTVLGYVEETIDGRRTRTEVHREYVVELWDRFTGTLRVSKPWAYLIPSSHTHVIENLQHHGIEVRELREDIELDVDIHTIDSLTKSPRPFQGHQAATIDATISKSSRMIPAGTFIVSARQKLSNLVVYLLEPMCEDGLGTWNFFDDHLALGGEFPVLRLPDETPLLTIEARSFIDAPQALKPITYDVAFGRSPAPNFSGSPAGGFTWLDDEHYLQTRDGRVRKVHAATGRSEVFQDLGPLEQALASLPTIGSRQARTLARRPGLRMTEARDAALIEHENDLYVARVDGTSAVRLTSTPQREELAAFSPDGAFVAFVRDNDIFVVDVATQTERRLTTDGSDTILNGKNDWVYFEEVFGRSWQAYWWSPDSSSIAFLRSDRSRVPLFTLVDERRDDQVIEVSHYPRPGQPNPIVTVGVVTAAGGTPRFIDFSTYNLDSIIVTGVGWWPDSNNMYVFVQDRVQTWVDVVMATATGQDARVLLRDQTKAWVSPSRPTFLKDGSLLWLSERTGYRHVYRYDRRGRAMGHITSGEWDVRGISTVSDDEKSLIVTARRDNPIATHLYRVGFTGGEDGITRLTPEAGDHRTSLSPSGTYFIDTWSTPDQPTRVELRDRDGNLVRTLDTNPVRALEEYRVLPAESLTIETPDGFPISARLIKPADFDPSRTYPVWFQTYAGPGAPTVRDGWSVSTWDQVLANDGFLVFRADPRSASGKGAASAWTAYRNLGAQELADIKVAVEWLTAHPWADGSRVGIQGHSYGGYMTAYAMTKSTLFAAGIAGAPVTDWRLYDTIYTERYMGTPQDNPEGYDESSVIKAAGNLHGRLLLAHGSLDDNVHIHNTIQLVQALQNARKDFDLMIYPGARHGIGGAHYRRLQYDFIHRHLLGRVDQGSPRIEEEPEAQTGP